MTEPAGKLPTVDPKDIKSLLNLPDTASDLELITALVALIAGLQEKYDLLKGDAEKANQAIANRDAALLDRDQLIAAYDAQAFADVITDDTREFWTGQLLANREPAVAALFGLRQKAPPAPSRVEGPRIRTVAELAGDPPPANRTAGKEPVQPRIGRAGV